LILSKSFGIKIVVGLVGFEPTTFTRSKARFRVCLAPTGFFTAPELLHPELRSANPYLSSGARRHAVPAARRMGRLLLDYSPSRRFVLNVSHI